ncbi:hypothetical protein SDC9_07707 [bioreactor metagenome]|uniref:Uncharacterized protein n=1 Tax=bioreactor metagenome TaxID=1076179 RepID=A0A644T5A3_9ZZZZ|nr:hypothetical protein [Methanobrevibacter sp.]MEA4956572.1 hypothetical protein [Methanobrevibacter sp.]
MIDNKSRDRLNISKNDREIYTKIIKSEGDLSGSSNTEIFLYSMMIGHYILKKREIVSPKEGYILAKYLTDDNWNLIRSIAVNEENSMEILQNIDAMFTIAEEYANAGIHRLNEWYFENEYDFIERVEEFLIGVYNDQRIGEEIED